MINNAYRENLGRDAAPEEIDHWEANINNGSITPNMAVQQISGSSEAGQFTGQALPGQAGPGQNLPGTGGGGNALRNNAPISNLVSGATGGEGVSTSGAGGNALRPAGDPYVENRVTPGNQYGTIEDMYRANLPNLQNALKTGRGDYDEAYNRAVSHMEEAWSRGERNVNKMLSETREILRPYGEAGEAALGRLDQAMAGDFSSFRESPDYRFRLEEGRKALVNQLSAMGQTGASGGQMSGAFGRAITELGQGMASTEYGNWWNRNQGLVNTGLQARGAEANALTSAGGTLANLASDVGSGKSTAAQFTGRGKSDLTRDIADMTTRYGIAARSADVNNALKSEALGIDWAKVSLAESEADKDRIWSERMADKGYDIWSNENQRNRQDDWWRTAVDVLI